jgi:hypothetical protein
MRLALICAAAIASSAGPAWAATLTVQRTSDDSGTAGCTASGTSTFSCLTLRDAVTYAGEGMAGTNPTVSLGSHIYTLTGQLIVGGPMTIAGTGAATTEIDQSTPGARVIVDELGAASLTLDDLEVTGGQLDSSNGSGTTDPCDPTADQAFGGGICSEAPLTLNDVAVTGNHATGAAGDLADPAGDPAVGGGIYATEALSLADSSVSGNTTQGGAGYPGTNTQVGGDGGVAGSAALTAGSAQISDSSITDNVANGGNGGTGGTTIVKAEAGNGGDVTAAISSTSATITGSTLSGNTVTGGAGGATTLQSNGGDGGNAYGGGLFTMSASISQATITGDSATGGAGGYAYASGLLGGAAGAAAGAGALLAKNPSSIASSMIAGNTAATGASGAAASGAVDQGAGQPAAGGGIANGIPWNTTSYPGTMLTITATTIAGDKAVAAGNVVGMETTSNGFGGGVASTVGTTTTIVNSTVFGNIASAPVAGGADGGGIDAEGAGTTVTLASDTLEANETSASTPADTFGGSVNSGTGAAVTLRDSSLAGAGAAGTHNCETDGGTLTDGGHNLEDDSARTCGFSAGGTTDDLVGVNPQLPSALGANGGPTQTLAPAPGSPVIRAGGACTDPTVTPPGPLSADQRGDPRGAACDIGAFQTEPIAVTGAPAVGGHVVTGSTVVCAQGSLNITGDGIRNAAGAIGATAVSYTWLANGKAIRGATAGSFRIPQSDVHVRLSCKVSATGAYGSGFASSRAVSVAALAPTISKLSQSKRRWRESGRRSGTKFTFSLNEAAKLTLRFARGRRRAGSIAIAGRAGHDTIRFAGRLTRRKRLAAGRYTLTITASADGLRSRPKTLKFTVL